MNPARAQDDQRTGQPVQVSELVQGFREATERHTSKSVADWREEFNRRLVDDIERGRLNPDKLFLLSQMNGLATRYGFCESDDIVISLVPIELLQSYHKIPIPVDKAMGRTATHRMAARLNPEKYGHLSSIYGRGRIRRIV